MPFPERTPKTRNRLPTLLSSGVPADSPLNEKSQAAVKQPGFSLCLLIEFKFPDNVESNLADTVTSGLEVEYFGPIDS